MAYKNITLLLILSSYIVISSGLTEQDELSKILTNIIYGSHAQRDYDRDLDMIDKNEHNRTDQKVRVQLFYECLCPDCIRFDTNSFKKALIELGKYLDISTYPYGNAKTFKDNNGHITFQCQHGPAECYGNKLHACALDILTNTTQALLYNSCMMEPAQDGRGSDDRAAERCSQRMQLDPEPIKACANGSKGVQLLYHYGEESSKINYDYVPYILVNQKVSDEDNFIKDICSAFASPPPQCYNTDFATVIKESNINFIPRNKIE